MTSRKRVLGAKENFLLIDLGCTSRFGIRANWEFNS